MWRCKECNGKIVGTGEIHTEIDFELDEYGDITENSEGFTLDELIKDDIYVYRYYCEDCGNEVESMDELSKIADWSE